MKKCASCMKDLPDAALHCVFCGAKQGSAPVAQAGNAKTVMGYSANEMIEQMKAHGVPAGTPGARPQPSPSQPPRPAQPGPFPPPQQPMMPSGPLPPSANSFPPPAGGNRPGIQPGPFAAPPTMAPTMAPAGRPGVQPGPFAPPPTMAPTMVPSAPHPPSNPPYAAPAPAALPRGGPQPHGSNAPTMMVTTDQQNPGLAATMAAPPPSAASGRAAFESAAPAGSVPIVISAPIAAPGPQRPAAVPFQPSQASARPGRPIEPWKDSLRLMMMVWGGVLLLAFATPLSIDPLAFNWNVIIDGEGMAKLMPLILASVGLLAFIVGAIPMTPAPRGILAAFLGLGGILTPMIVAMTEAMPPWQVLVELVAPLLLVPGLLIRAEYRGSIAPRIMVTLGALALLALVLIPVNDTLPIVGTFDTLLDGEGMAKVAPIVQLAGLLIVVASLLVWLPAPSTGAAKILAWLFIMWPLVEAIAKLIIVGHIGDAVPKSPNGTLMEWAPMSGYLVLVGYGLATAIGKQLE